MHDERYVPFAPEGLCREMANQAHARPIAVCTGRPPVCDYQWRRLEYNPERMATTDRKKGEIARGPRLSEAEKKLEDSRSEW